MKNKIVSFFILIIFLSFILTCDNSLITQTLYPSLITFDSNGGSQVDSQTVYRGEKAVRPSDPVRGDNGFLGWFVDNWSFQVEWDFDNEPEGDLVLYAGWDGEYNPGTEPGTDPGTEPKKPLTITGIGAGGREYNGSAVIDNWWIDPENGEFIGLEEGDEVYIIAGPEIFLGTMADKNVGSEKPVTVDIPLYGKDAGKYYLIQPDYVTVNIYQAPLVITGAQHSKVYDGEMTADDVHVTLSGIIQGDSVSYSNVFAYYESAEIGTTTLIINGVELSGPDAGNYYCELYYYGTNEYTVEGILAAILYHTVSFNANGATGAVPAAIQVQQGHSATMPAKGNLTYINNGVSYTFNGWNTKADGSGSNYAAGSVLFVPTEDTVLYARWILSNTVELTIAQIENGKDDTIPIPDADATISVSGSNYYVNFVLPADHGYTDISWVLNGTEIGTDDSVTISTTMQQASLPGIKFLTLTGRKAGVLFSKTIQITVVD
jgi:hypothetical protein